MKQKQYLFIAISLLVLVICVVIYGLFDAGILSKNKLMVQALACHECPSHEVIIGGGKLSGQLPDSADKGDVSRVFLTGVPNPYQSDYTKTYDYYTVTGKLVDVKRTIDDGPQYPVISVTAWQEVNFGKGWLYGGIIFFLLAVSVNFYRRFVNANKESILKSSIRVNEDIPD